MNQPMVDADRMTKRTLPAQLRDQLMELIAAEGITAGGKLPSEPVLSARFKVGRSSLREALKLLEQDGVISTRHGDGRYLTTQPTLDRPLTKLEGVTEMLASRGLPLHSTVLDVAVQEPSAQLSTQLALPPGEAVVRLERLRRHEDDAVLYSTDFFARSLVPQPVGEVDWSGSLFALLAEHGHLVSYAVTQVRATTMNDQQRGRVGPDADGAWLQLLQTHHDAAGRPLLYSDDYHRGNNFAFHLVRRRG